MADTVADADTLAVVDADATEPSSRRSTGGTSGILHTGECSSDWQPEVDDDLRLSQRRMERGGGFEEGHGPDRTEQGGVNARLCAVQNEMSACQLNPPRKGRWNSYRGDPAGSTLVAVAVVSVAFSASTAGSRNSSRAVWLVVLNPTKGISSRYVSNSLGVSLPNLCSRWTNDLGLCGRT